MGTVRLVLRVPQGPTPSTKSVGGPHTFRIEGPQIVVVQDVLFGDVWICSGQSNMDWGMWGVNNPNVTTVLYNGMIAPLLPFAVKGAIWYQGESNAGRPAQYRTLLPTTIHDWRSRFGVGDFPFPVVQLANFMGVQQQPVESGWAELREAQLLTALNDPHCGLAVAIDIGEANDIHPKNKQDVGGRLALAARGMAYDQSIEYSGPEFKSMEVADGKARLRFEHVGGGLIARDGEPLKGFAIAGADKRFVFAEAKIDGDTVIVSSLEIAQPAVVRYGWANNPVCNFYNKADLPALPFRTDVEDQ